jgi:hypothetical protein
MFTHQWEVRTFLLSYKLGKSCLVGTNQLGWLVVILVVDFKSQMQRLSEVKDYAKVVLPFRV